MKVSPNREGPPRFTAVSCRLNKINIYYSCLIIIYTSRYPLKCRGCYAWRYLRNILTFSGTRVHLAGFILPPQQRLLANEVVRVSQAAITIYHIKVVRSIFYIYKAPKYETATTMVTTTAMATAIPWWCSRYPGFFCKTGTNVSTDIVGSTQIVDEQ